MGEKADASGGRSPDVELRDVHHVGTTPRHPRLPAIRASCAPDDFFRLEQSSVLQTSRYHRALGRSLLQLSIPNEPVALSRRVHASPTGLRDCTLRLRVLLQRM